MEKKKEQIYDDIDKTDLSTATKRVYKSRINTIFNIDEFPNDLIGVLEKINPNNNTNSEVNIIGNLLAIANISKTFKKIVEDDLDVCREMYDKLMTKQRQKNPIETRDNDITWGYLLSLNDNLENKNITGDDRLIYHLYINPGIGFIPRNDFAQMKIVDNLEDAEKDEELNYYVRDKKLMLFNEYKTSKRYGQIKVKVSAELDKYIPKKQDWIFEQGDKPMLDNSIGKKITRAFKRLSGGKHITLVSLRRAFATHIKDLPDDERRKLALKMGHSSTTNTSYSHNKEDEINERVAELE